MHALRLVSKNSRYIARLYKPTRVAACYFSTTPALRQQVPPYQQNMQQHHQQQEHQQQQQEIVMPPGGSGEAVPQELVIEVTEKNMAMLEQKVPMVIDLYSHREGNTAAQTARLTQAVQNCEGAVKLARINVDRFPEVLDNMGITPELLPASVYIYGGRPIARHMGKGAVIESAQLDKYMQALLKVAGISSTRVVLKSAEQHMENGDLESARKIYEEILHNKQAKSEGMALAGLAQCALKENKLDEAEELLAVVKNNYKEDIENSYVKKAFAALEFAKASGGSNEADLLAKLKDNPKDIEAKYSLAVLYSASGKPEEAINEAIGIIKIDKQYNEQAARKLLLQIFEMLGSDHPLTVKGRKRLSAVWYL